MIGLRYWSTGITLVPDQYPGVKQWTARLTFLDNGFCEADATEGELRLRYFVDDLEVGAATLKQDAERLGITWDNASDRGPTVYVDHDGELEDGDYPELRGFANGVAQSLGWKPAYTDAVAMREL